MRHGGEQPLPITAVVEYVSSPMQAPRHRRIPAHQHQQPMKPIWLIETGVWKDDNVARMIAILRELGLKVHAEPFTPLGGTEFEIAEEDCPVIFYGSLNTAEYLASCGKHGCRSSGSTLPCLAAGRIRPLGETSASGTLRLLPTGRVSRLKERLYGTFGKDGLVFIRPDDNNSPSPAAWWPRLVSAQWYEEAVAGRPDPAALAVVSSPVRIEANGVS